ncbi:hypothetical protein Tco_1483457 [Tanacetum coccineum]
MSNTKTNLPTQTSSVLHNDTVSSCSTSKVQEKIQLSRSRCMNSLREIKSQFKFLTETLQDFGLNPLQKKITKSSSSDKQTKKSNLAYAPGRGRGMGRGGGRGQGRSFGGGRPMQPPRRGPFAVNARPSAYFIAKASSNLWISYAFDRKLQI